MNAPHRHYFCNYNVITSDMSIVSIYPVSNYGPDGGLAGLEVLNASTVIGEAIKKVVVEVSTVKHAAV
jgi:hypothetical protein